MHNREEKMETVMDKIEQNLELIGITAIEDKLQDGVGDTIVSLREAGIKVRKYIGASVWSFPCPRCSAAAAAADCSCGWYCRC